MISISMNSTDYSKNLFSAIDIITDKKMRELALDRTIKCLIVRSGYGTEIEVSHQGQKFIAYSSGGVTYQKNQVVYVLIPQGDMSNKKFIIEQTSSSGSGSGPQISLIYANNEDINGFEELT